MESIVLDVKKRTVLGKKVKDLRRQGITPANVFGGGIESQSIEMVTAEAEKVLAKAGSTHLVTLKEGGSKTQRRVLAKRVQRDAITGELIHVDFHQVRMKAKVKVEVPLAFEGDSPAYSRKDLLLFEESHSVEVECLPGDIPESIVADVSSLAESGDQLLVKDLQLSGEVTILTSPEMIVARVAPAKKAEVEKAPEEEEAVAEEEAVEEPAVEESESAAEESE